MSDPNTRIGTLLGELANQARLDPALERRTLRRVRRHRVANAAAALVAVTVVVGLGALGVRQIAGNEVPASRLPAPGVAGVTACSGSTLRGKLAEQTGAAGIIRTAWQLTNVSGSTCRASGYPAIAFHTDAGWVNARARYGGYPDIEGPPTPVRVRPGHTASVVTYWSDVTTTVGSCLTFDEVRIALRDGQSAIQVAATGCVDPSHVYVGPLTPGKHP